MSGLREGIEKFRSLPGPPSREGANFALHYYAKFGRLPDGWEMVFGVPRRVAKSWKKPALTKTAVLKALPTPGLNEATFSRDVNPNVVDIAPIPTPTGGTRKANFPRFRANLTSGNRTKTHHDDPHRHCGDVYDPACRDREWETPTWIGGTDWVKHPLYHHKPPDAREVFAQDPLGLNKPDVPLAEQVARFRELSEATSSSGIGAMMKTPLGLLSRASSSVFDLFRSSATAPKSPQIIAKRKRRKSSYDDYEHDPLFTRHKPGTPEHGAALYRQAIELRRLTGKSMYIVDYGGGRQYVTSRPRKHGKIVHVVEATTTADVGAHLVGRRGLKTLGRRKKRQPAEVNLMRR